MLLWFWEITASPSLAFPLVKKPYPCANKAKSYHLSGCTANSINTSLIASSDLNLTIFVSLTMGE